MGRVDCDKEGMRCSKVSYQPSFLNSVIPCFIVADICAAYHISKYPSLKLWRSGQVAKKEYRGQRTQEAFLQHLHEQLKDPILPIKSVQENETPEVSTVVVLRQNL